MPQIKCNSNLIGKRIPYQNLCGDRDMVLLDVSVVYEYVDGKFTDKVVGTVYIVAELTDFERLRVRINDPVPAITGEKLAAIRGAGKKVFVSFDDLTVMVYINQTACSIEESYRATGIKILGQSE